MAVVPSCAHRQFSITQWFKRSFAFKRLGSIFGQVYYFFLIGFDTRMFVRLQIQITELFSVALFICFYASKALIFIKFYNSFMTVNSLVSLRAEM